MQKRNVFLSLWANYVNSWCYVSFGWYHTTPRCWGALLSFGRIFWSCQDNSRQRLIQFWGNRNEHTLTCLYYTIIPYERKFFVTLTRLLTTYAHKILGIFLFSPKFYPFTIHMLNFWLYLSWRSCYIYILAIWFMSCCGELKLCWL